MAPKILIVDDDFATRVGLQQLLAGGGYDAIVAPDFREGRRALEQDHPDLVVVDLRLQGYNGLQLLHLNPRVVPAIVVTGYPDDVLQGDARRLGAEYVVKPIDPERFLGLIGRLLSPERQPERRRALRQPITTDLPLEVNAVPATLLDASTTGIRFEISRPAGQTVPRGLTLVFPVHDFQVGADLVWAKPEGAGRWECGASVRDESGQWAALLASSS